MLEISWSVFVGFLYAAFILGMGAAWFVDDIGTSRGRKKAREKRQ